MAGADLDVAAGKIVYTQLLNERGGIEADVTVTRLAEQTSSTSLPARASAGTT